MSPVADPRIARIEQGIAKRQPNSESYRAMVLADLRAWQEIAERHHGMGREICLCCADYWPCPDRQAANAALDRLDALWAGESRG